jgi:hypothetical protein
METGKGHALTDAAGIPDEAKLAAFPGGGFDTFEVAVNELEVTGTVIHKQSAVVGWQAKIQTAGRGDGSEEQGYKKTWHRSPINGENDATQMMVRCLEATGEIR